MSKHTAMTTIPGRILNHMAGRLPGPLKCISLMRSWNSFSFTCIGYLHFFWCEQQVSILFAHFFIGKIIFFILVLKIKGESSPSRLYLSIAIKLCVLQRFYKGYLLYEHFLMAECIYYTSFDRSPLAIWINSQFYIVNNAAVNTFSLNNSGNFLGWNPDDSPADWSYFILFIYLF